jgi:hypothetical protein
LFRERAQAPAGAALRVSVEPVPLLAVDADTLAPSQTVILSGHAVVSPTVAAATVANGGGGLLTVLEAF